jgi:hypothetical protein
MDVSTLTPVACQPVIAIPLKERLVVRQQFERCTQVSFDRLGIGTFHFALYV